MKAMERLSSAEGAIAAIGRGLLARTLAETPTLGNGRIASKPNERVKSLLALTGNEPPPMSRTEFRAPDAALQKPK
jgi:hypothetical protein